MTDFETEEAPKKKKQDVKIIPYTPTSMKITTEENYFILEPSRYNINTLMMLIDLKKINHIEEHFQKHPKGLDVFTFIKLLNSQLKTNPNDPFDEINMIYGLYKLFCEIDLNCDGLMQWSEFTQFIIDRVEGEDDSIDPNDEKDAKEKEMLRYKRYMISDKVKDYNIHKKDVIAGVYHAKIDKLLVCEYDSKIIKVYNPRSGKCELNFDIERYFQEKIIEEEKEKKGRVTKKQKFNIELVKSFTFSVLSMCLSPHNILALCLSSNKICFFTFNAELKAECIYEMQTTILQKRIWYLKEHGIWVTSGRKGDNDKYYYLYELDIEFERNGNNKYEVLYNKGHWYRNVFYENPNDPSHPHYNQGHKDEITDVIEITKPLLVLTGSMDGKIRLININDKDFLKVWKAHDGGIRCLTYNSELGTNGLILSTGFEYYINVFATDLSLDDAHKGKLEGHDAPVVSVTFLGDSCMCASVDEDAVVKIWDTRIKQCLQTIPCDKRNITINRMLYIKRYNRFVTYGSKMLFYDPKYSDNEINRVAREYMGVNYPIQCVFNTYYMQFYVATMKDIRIYSAVDGTLLRVFKKCIHQERFDSVETKIRTFCFDYRHRLMYLGFSNGTVQQFNAGNGSLIKPINEFEVEIDGITTIKTHHTKDVTALYFYYDKPDIQDETNYILVTTSLDSLVNMYNETKKEAHVNKEKLKEFNIERKEEEESTKIRGIRNSHKIGEKVNEILCMDFSKRYNKLATGSIDGLVVVWDFEVTRMEDLLFVKSYHPGNFNAVIVKFLDPYPVIAVAYSNADLYLWGVKPNSKYKGECFFRCKNFLRKETGFYPTPITSMLFIHHEHAVFEKDVKHEEEFNAHLPKDIEIDDELYHYNVDNNVDSNNTNTNTNSNTNSNAKSYLVIGDQKGWMRCINVLPIFTKYDITIMEESVIKSTLNIMKREEVNAEHSLMFHYQLDKEFTVGFTSLYCDLIKYEHQVHNDEITYLSLIQEPTAFISVSKDQHIKIWNLSLQIIGELFTGATPLHHPLSPWKFNVNWENVKQHEMEQFVDVLYNGGFNTLLPKLSEEDAINAQRNKVKDIQILSPIEVIQNELFKTVVLPVVKKKRFKKIEHKKEKNTRYDEDNKITESYEGRFIEDMKRKIDDMFTKHGEEVGMNEMSRNVIDNVANRKDILELFQTPQQQQQQQQVTPQEEKEDEQQQQQQQQKTIGNNSTRLKLPKLNPRYTNTNTGNSSSNKLYGEHFAKKSKMNNLRDSLITPLRNHDFKSNELVKYKQGQTEKILSLEYYTNSYKSCCRIKHSIEPIESIRNNYRMMWNFVDKYPSKCNPDYTRNKNIPSRYLNTNNV